MSDRFERFTPRAQQVLTLAQEEAQRLNHNYIGTEHLLLGLVREKDGIAALVLSKLGADLDKVRNAVEQIVIKGERPPSGDIGLTPRSKKVIELAVDEARRLYHHYIGTEHLLLGLVREGEGVAAGILESLGIGLDRVRNNVIAVLMQPNYATASSFEPASTLKVGQLLEESVSQLRGYIRELERLSQNQPHPPKPLTNIGTSLLRQAQVGELDPLIGRENELDRLLVIINRRHNPHAVIIGESGVGKSALIRGLALRAAKDDSLSVADIIWLDQHNFVDFVLNPGQVLQIIREQERPVVLCLPHLDRLIELNTKTSRFAAIFDLLHQPNLCMISTTTPDGYERIKELEPRLARRFQPVPLAEIDAAGTLLILQGLKSRYEEDFGVKIEDEALKVAVVLSQKYLVGRTQPTKAFDLLDEACSSIVLSFPSENMFDNSRVQLEMKEETPPPSYDTGSEDDKPEAKAYEEEENQPVITAKEIMVATSAITGRPVLECKM